MKTISNDIISTLEIEKSKFITILKYVDNISDVKSVLNKIKIDYPKATHYCYAYIIDNNKKCSDDGEPSGTAGAPILNVLENNNLNFILAIVVRYFGGIKLGAGGLVRAYTKSITNSLDDIYITNLVSGKLIKINYNYDNSKDIEYLIKDLNLINKAFADTVTITFEIADTELKIIDEIKKSTNDLEIIKNIYIKK